MSESGKVKVEKREVVENAEVVEEQAEAFKKVEVTTVQEVKEVPAAIEKAKEAPEAPEEATEATEEDFKEVAAAEVVEGKEEAKKEVVEEIEDDSDIFVTEDDTFDVKVEYCKADGVLCVKNVQDEYDDNNHAAKEFSVTLKYPNQGDVNTIGVYAKEDIQAEDFGVKNYQNIEFARLVVLIRKWTFKKEVNNENVISLHPDIIKGIEFGVREKIGSLGII